MKKILRSINLIVNPLLNIFFNFYPFNMKVKSLILLLLMVNLNLFAKIQCCVKIGLSDCINCYNVLSTIKDFDREFVLKGEYLGLENEIINEYLGISDESKIIVSDSLYNSFGYGDFTVISFWEDQKEILKFPMSLIGGYSTEISEMKRKNILTDVKPVDLSRLWHVQCQLKMLQSGNFAILDPLRRKITKYNTSGQPIATLVVTRNLEELIYNSYFTNGLKVLDNFTQMANHLNSSPTALHFNSIFIRDEIVYLQTSGSYFAVSNGDTILQTFNNLLRLDSVFQIEIIKLVDQIGEGCFLSSNFIASTTDSTFLCDVICTNPSAKPRILAKGKLKENILRFDEFTDDTIPMGLVDKRLYYRITSFNYSEGYVGYGFFNKVFYHNSPLINLVLFDEYKFNNNFPDPKNFLNGLKKIDDYLFISYQVDSLCNIRRYNLRKHKLEEAIISVPVTELGSLIQFDSKGNFFFVNSEKQLIIKPLGDYFKSMQKN